MGIYDRDYYREHHKQQRTPPKRARFPVLRVVGLTLFYCGAVLGFVFLAADVAKLLR